MSRSVYFRRKSGECIGRLRGRGGKGGEAINIYHLGTRDDDMLWSFMRGTSREALIDPLPMKKYILNVCS